MRLNKLILHGFKSFADRTEFVFDSPITGIVGPNGCGKSNVVDGFKWVLGEQSAKSLRGDAMMDVIFNGSGGRKPAGMAEVVLVFDNPLRADGTRHLGIDTDEVAVGRRLFRDGTSEYQLNNQPSRLKDIRELFLDTGVGVDAYSVIEQGRVAALLEANPDERRLIFEEAAGISKYKAKKKEAQRKLERVDQNIIRLHDIVEEVEKRLRSVKVQAGRARTFQEYSTRLNELRLSYSLQEYHAHQQQLAQLDAGREDLQFRLDDAAGNLAKQQNALAGKREQYEAMAQRRQQLEYELVQTQAAAQSAAQRQQYAKEQIQHIAEQIQSLEQDRAASEAKLAEVSGTLQSEKQSLSQLTAELEQSRVSIERRQQEFRDGQLQLNELANQIEQNKAAILDLMRKLAGINSRLASIEIERKNADQQQARLSERREVVAAEIQSVDTRRAQLQGQLDEILITIEQQQARLIEKRDESSNLGKQIAQLGQQLGAAREHRSGLISRQKLLQDLEARREGVSEGVKSVLRQRDQKFSFIRGLVADILRVDIEHARVVEAALDGRDQWLVASDLDRAIESRELFEELEGRVNVFCPRSDRDPASNALQEISGLLSIPSSRDNPAAEGSATSAARRRYDYDWNRHTIRVRFAVDLVRVEPADQALLQHLLGDTIVVDTLAEAVELHKSAERGFRYVTGAGEVLESDGTLRAGPLTAAMGLLSRRSELDAIGAQIVEVDGRIAALTEELTSNNATARALEEEQNGLRNLIYQSNTQKVEFSSSIAQANDRLASLMREHPLLDRELNGLIEQVARLTDEAAALSTDHATLESDQLARQQAIDAAGNKHEELAASVKQWSEELTAARVALGQVQEKQLSAEQAVARYESSARELAQQIERVIKSAETVASRRTSIQTELEQAEYQQARLVEQQDRLAGEIAQAAAQLSAVQQEVQSLVGQVESLRGEHGELEQQLHAVQVKLSELRVRLETLVARTLEEFQLDLPARYAEHRDADGGYQPENLDWDAIAQEIKELRDKIHRLGNVNLDAIGELDELEQRQQFLSKQWTDLIDSKKQLEELIETINAESGIRFEQTFNAVREHFQGMFRKLFGGGKADIYLETELAPQAGSGTKPSDSADAEPAAAEQTPARVSVLDAGIEIIARPPGKQPVSISQLSGGEKTMTCVALLMSIFKSKPSPFCILDEVDAALDEANNQRFNLIVQEFLAQSQFIVITHSKRTMQIADVLYGVTMQEQGVSKRVAVKFDQVDAQGRISESAAA
jgi:chromosome segregation protein